MAKRKKKGFVEKAIDDTEKKIKKAVKKQVKKRVTNPVKKQVRKTRRKAVRKVKKGARSAFDRARIKPQQMVREMRTRGLTNEQIGVLIGASEKTVENIGKGKTKGTRLVQPLREARRTVNRRTKKFHRQASRGKKPDAWTLKPVPSAKMAGAGAVRRTKTGTTIFVDENTSKEWIRLQQRQARGKIQIKRREAKPPAPGRGGGAKPPKPPRPPKPPAGPPPAPSEPPKPPAPPRRPRPPQPAPEPATPLGKLHKAMHGVFSNKTVSDYQILKAAEAWWGSKKAIAEELGVSTRSVQRWMRQGRINSGRVRSAAIDKIRNLYKTPELRRAMEAPRASQKKIAGGMKMKMSGSLGPIIAQGTPAEKDYTRLREMETEISEEGMAQIWEAWRTGDEEFLRETVREIIELEYGVSNWNWHEDSDFNIAFD